MSRSDLHLTPGERLPVAVVLVDALRHDWVTPERAPFLASMAARGEKRDIRDTFGFAGLRPAVFHGLEPADAGLVFLWERARERGPLSWLRLVPRLARRPRTLRLLRRVANAARRRLDPLSAPLWDLDGIPWEILSGLRYAESRSPLDPRYLGAHPSILSRHDPRHVAWLGYPHDDQRTGSLLELLPSRLDEETEFLWVHFAELDWKQHEEGPDGPGVPRVLGEMDHAVAQVHAACERAWKGRPFLFVAFGDHGACEVKRTVDLEALLGLDPTRPRSWRGVDYFLDSTMARFWSDDASRLAEIRARLATVPDGRVVTPDELPALGCRYRRETFGDVFFALEEGAVIAPCFFRRGDPPRGMHGYLPGREDDVGACLFEARGVSLPDVPGGEIGMTDLHALLSWAQGHPVPFPSELTTTTRAS